MRGAMLVCALAFACAASPAFAQTRVLTVPGLVPLDEEATPADEGAARRGKAPARAQAPANNQMNEVPAVADTAPAEAPGRFSFQRVPNGVLRLDRATGEVSFCRASGSGWVCEAVPEDRAALEKEIEQLRDEVASLKKEVAGLQPAPESPPRPPQTVPPTPQPDTSAENPIKLPSSGDIARARAFIAQTWHRLVEMIENWQKDVLRKT